MKRIILFASILFLFSCRGDQNTTSLKDYHALTDSGVQTGGVRMIPIKTPAGTFNVWTKRFGNNPKIKVLLLHGGPGGTHEFFESFESFLPQEGIEFYEYDQLGSYFSDQPKDTSLWVTARFVEEVEQVRKALGLNKDNFYLLGHSWGGILAMEYALKYQDNLKGLIISNMMSSAPLYGKYAEEVLAKQMDPKVLDTIRTLEARGDFNNPKYMELLMPNFYAQHFCRVNPWPEMFNRAMPHLNQSIYVMMQGPSEFGVGGSLAKWDRSKDLPKIKPPTLTIGGKHDTMDPEHMKWMAGQVQNGRSLTCPNGSHCSMWDDQPNYFPGLISFIKDVDAGTFKK
ncbi:proline iminopeptidase-family hydrolase [Sediminibacterium roseum]|uniref:Proline iminopeptidase-family hydrolase n=1 Tax=Sediminibacterium roseum TaxID=1978412 RepID=A0ABW9ZMK6_9BACT|nr:proline iminopeptidase-family hydrolase [Sediminibacterium roseum]NCI48302.1 proline iminopeptidase-family hydrolase [Sediminibacterium roseum]